MSEDLVDRNLREEWALDRNNWIKLIVHNDPVKDVTS